jgi:hypothetical protein
MSSNRTSSPQTARALGASTAAPVSTKLGSARGVVKAATIWPSTTTPKECLLWPAHPQHVFHAALRARSLLVDAKNGAYGNAAVDVGGAVERVENHAVVALILALDEDGLIILFAHLPNGTGQLLQLTPANARQTPSARGR